MPTPPLPDELARAAYEAYRQHGQHDIAAKAQGIPTNTHRNRYNTAIARGLHLSEGARGVIKSAKLAPVEARGGWLHSYDDEGKKIGATRWEAPQAANDIDRLTAIREAFEGMERALPVAPPAACIDDLMTVYPLFDVHWGMHAWGKETGGQDYDLKLAEADLLQAMSAVMALSPASGTGLLLIGGDFFHANDNTSQTPASRHVLDVDGRHFKVIGSGVNVIKAKVGMMLTKHKKVVIRVMRGNHDEDSYLCLYFALAERYANETRVEVIGDPRDLFMFQFGRTAVFAHHGDKTTAKEFVLRLADQCQFWTETPHRYAYTGHRHNQAAERIGGVYWERLDAFCPPDSYGSRWASRRNLTADTYHRKSGRVIRAVDPIEREVA